MISLISRHRRQPAPSREPVPRDVAEAWQHPVDQFIAQQSALSRACAALTHPIKPRPVNDFRNTFDQVTKHTKPLGYCFGMTALWLHACAHGRGDAFMRQVRHFSRARSLLLPRAKRRQPLRQAEQHLCAMNARQFHGQHPLQGSGVHQQTIIVTHCSAAELLDTLTQHPLKHRLWEISSAQHTIGLHFSQAGCTIYDVNDPTGTITAPPEARQHVASYLHEALRFGPTNEQPLILIAFARTPLRGAVPTEFINITQTTINAIGPAGRSAARMVLQFMPASTVQQVLDTFDVADVSYCIHQVAAACRQDTAFFPVLAHLMRSPDLDPALLQDAARILRVAHPG